MYNDLPMVFIGEAVWTVEEKLCKIWLIIREYSMYNMFTWKSEV